MRMKVRKAGLMRRHLSAGVTAFALALPSAAAAQEQGAAEQGTGGELPRLGMAPAEPGSRSAPPAIPFGIDPSTSRDFVLDFHGYVLVPARVAYHKRETDTPGQRRTALHSPPLIPQDLRSFEYTGIVPEPWVQLNFTYGNSLIAATAVLAARAISTASTLYNPVDQLGVNDAFLTVNLTDTFKTPFDVKVGAFTGRYGVMGEYDAGRYGTPLIARTNSIGEAVTAGFHFGDLNLVIEQGLGGQLGRPPDGLVPAGWNDFAEVDVGASFVNHLHAGLGYKGLAQLGLHYLYAWSQDDRVAGGPVPDGSISVLGADLRFRLGRAGHLYAGVARTTATDASSVSGIIEILNARGGPELIDEYLGPNGGGDGGLTTFGAQYDLSLAKLVYGDRYQGRSPDVLVSAFGLGTTVDSDDPAFDGVTKLKGGFEATYGMLSWFGLSTRIDHVRENVDQPRQAFTILSPRVLFHTDWQSRDEFALQYSRFIYGGDVVVKTGYPPEDDPDANPDEHVFSLSGTFWW
jgi:hypothetical protein